MNESGSIFAQKFRLRGTLVAATVYATALIAVYWPFLGNPGTLYARVVRDFWSLYNSYPEFDLSYRLMYRYGRFPLWNFLSGFGQPLLGDMQSAPFHPARLLFFFGFWKVIDIWLLLRVFISGMLSYSFLRRNSVGVSAAIFGGLAWMFTGSITDYMNMHYLDIDLMLPAGAIVFGLLADKGRGVHVIGAALIVCLAFFAGNPTSTLYLLIFLSAYYFFMVYRLREDVFGGWVRFLCAAMLSGLLAAIVLIPFREYLAYSWDYHPDGVGGITISPRHLLTLFGPEAYGPEAKSGVPLIQRIPYFGVLPMALAFYAALCVRRIPATAAFLVAFFLLAIGMVIGALPFGFISYIPLLIRTSNFRYAVPEAAFCIAMLAGFALDHMSRWRESPWKIALLPIVITMLGAWLVTSRMAGTPVEPVYARGVVFIVAISWIASFALFLFNLGRIRITTVATVAIALWIFEAGVHFHFTPEIAPNDPKIYSQLPAEVDQRVLLEGRNYAMKGLLYPNLNLVHSAMDLRYLGALYPRRYADFMRMFNDLDEDQLLQEFIPYNFMSLSEDRIESPLMDLMGITTIVSDLTLPKNVMVPRIADSGDVTSPAENYIFAGPMTVKGDMRMSLRQHPPSRISFDAEIGFIFLGIAIDETKWGGGDGVFFNVYREEPKGPRLIFSRFVDPTNNPSDRRWLDFVIPHRGGRMIFETQPSYNFTNDWAAWGDIRSSNEEQSRYNQIEDAPFKIYENLHAMPGAFVVGNVDVAEDPDEDAWHLAAAYDFRRSVIVEGSDAYSLRRGIEFQEDYRIGLDRIFGDRVKLSAELFKPGVVVLTDLYYPGWKALIDGREVKIFPADVAFRAVKSEAGKHVIEFVYAPASFKIGLWISIVSFVMLVTISRRKVVAVEDELAEYFEDENSPSA